MWDLATADDRWRSANRYLELAPPGDVAGVPDRCRRRRARPPSSAATWTPRRCCSARSARVSAELPPGHLTVLHDSVDLELLLARGELGEVRRRARLLPEGSGAPAVNFELCAGLQDGDGGDAVTRLAAEIQPSELAPFVLLLGASVATRARRPPRSRRSPRRCGPACRPARSAPSCWARPGYAAGVLGDRAHAEALLRC